MKIPSFIAVAFLIVSGTLGLQADEAPMSLETISKIFRFPASELVMRDVSERERSLQGDAVLRAYEITGKKAFTFFPVVVSVAGEGTFMNKHAMRELAKFDSAPRDELEKAGAGFLGSLPQIGEYTGGIYLEEILTLTDDDDNPFKVIRPAIASATNIASKHIDIRIAIFTPFPHKGDELIPVLGGESYYQTLGPTNFDDVTVEMRQQMQADMKIMFIGFNELVRKSPLVADKASPGTSSDPIFGKATSPRSTAPKKALSSPKNSGEEAAALAAQNEVPLWPWALCAALAAVVVVVIGLRRRA